MGEIRDRMSKIKDPSYMKYALADILIIIMCGVLCGLDTPEELVVYAKSKEDYLRETFGIKQVSSKATFGRVLSMVDGKQIGEAILDVLHERLTPEPQNPTHSKSCKKQRKPIKSVRI